MISEERLRMAAMEAAEAILQSLPSQEDILYTPSSSFTKRMKKLIFRVEHPVLYYGMRSAACLLALVLSSSILLFGISPDVRAAVLGWFKELKGGTHFEYNFEGDNAADMTGVRYEPGWVPEGFELVMNETIENHEVFAYVDEKGFNAEFSYIYASDVGAQNMLVDGGQPYYMYTTVEVMGYKADCYMSKDAEHTSALVWIDENDTLFTVTAMLTKEELINWAESIIEIRE